jgi:hypothetical protein
VRWLNESFLENHLIHLFYAQGHSLSISLGLGKSDWLIFFENFEMNLSDCLIRELIFTFSLPCIGSLYVKVIESIAIGPNFQNREMGGNIRFGVP